MEFIRAAPKGDLKLGEKTAISVGGRDVLVANLEDNYYAVGNICTHMGCMLSDGELIGGNIECPCHGSVFDVKTGNVVNGPAKKPEPTYQVKIEGDQVLVRV